MANTISNTDDLIDSRDVIERIEELQTKRGEARFIANWNMPGYMPENEGATFETSDEAMEWLRDEAKEHAEQDSLGDDEAMVKLDAIDATIDAWEADHEGEFGVTIGNWHYYVCVNPAPLDDEDTKELADLESLAEEAEGYASDWQHGATLIRDDYFVTYAQELAEDCGMIKDNAQWPYTCIDWEKAAQELQTDYTSVEFDGVTYWVR